MSRPRARSRPTICTCSTTRTARSAAGRDRPGRSAGSLPPEQLRDAGQRTDDERCGREQPEGRIAYQPLAGARRRQGHGTLAPATARFLAVPGRLGAVLAWPGLANHLMLRHAVLG